MVLRNVSVERESCCPQDCVLQAEEVLLAPTVPEMAMTTEVTTSFVDANTGSSVGVSTAPLDYELADAQTSADLASFLARPVRIQSLTWDPSDPVGFKLSNQTIWGQFLNNTSIKNKLSNYAFIRGNLKLKIVTNASPFLYGSMRAVYRPLHLFKGLTVTSSFPSALMPYSQMPGVWITPAHSEGAEFTCPFVWPKSFIRTAFIAEANAMGALDLIVYNSLASANGATSSVTVQVFAWMEDVVLAGPTVGAVLQADEYGVGVVSAPASAIAAAASEFSQVPTIGRFAKATEIGASAVSNIAKLFGFTNVPVIEDTRPVRNSPFPSLSSAEIGYPHDKLALDAKNELSIDPAIAGLDSEDELAISQFVQRESFLVGTSWTSASPTDTPLFTSLVLPQLTYATGYAIDFTPTALVSNLFRNWRGDMIFRFKFIATPFHKGRVRISYDPQSASIQNVGDTGPFVLNKIVDLGAETDVEFRIPYQQALPWCYNLASNQQTIWSISNSPSFSSLTDTFHNGMISMKVLTALTGPTTASSVGVQVFVRGAENLEFANPISAPTDLTPFAIQSEEYSEKGNAMSDTMGSSSEASTHRALVNFGESVKSLRTLMRRHNLLDTIVLPAPSNSCGTIRLSQTRFPAHYGYDPNGLNLAKGVLVPLSNFDFNFVNTTPWHLISNCFLAQRGSMNWVFHPTRSSQSLTSRVTRRNDLFGTYSLTLNNGPLTNDNVKACNYWKYSTPTAGGTSLTHTQTTSGHAICAPSYSPFKFQSTSPALATDPAASTQPAYDGTVYDWLAMEIPFDTSVTTLGSGTVERYFGVGADYTLHFFMNCPTLNYLNAGTVVPV